MRIPRPDDRDGLATNMAWPYLSLWKLIFRNGVITLCILLAGCQTMHAPDIKMPWSKDKKKNVEQQLPDRILTIWSDTVLHQPGEPGIRGFGGRIYFYHDDKDDPIEVDGGLMVYAFDAEDFDPSNPAPLKRFVFTPDQFESHHSKTSMGHSYSVWLPWDKVGGPNRSISLVTRFEGRHGGVVISDSVNKMLPGVGKSEQDTAEVDRRDYGVQQATYTESPPTSESNLSQDEIGRKRPVPMTIDLPPQFNRHLFPMERESTEPIEAMEAESTVSPRSFERVQPNEESVPLSYEAYLDFMRKRAETEAASNDEETSSEESPRGAHFERRRYPVRMKPGSQEDPSPVRRQPHRGGWLSELPPTPRSGVNARLQSPFASSPAKPQGPRP